MRATGLIHGRFQPPHLDHLRYLLAGFACCEHLLVGITNPDPLHSGESPADPERSKPGNNPYSYHHRAGMLEAALDAEGIARTRYRITPFPVLQPELWPCYVPSGTTFLLSIYDAWGEDKLARFQQAGVPVKVIRRVAQDEKGISATEVRRRMRQGEDWAELLPPAVAEYIRREGLVLQG